MPLEAGADGNGCDRSEVRDWRSRVLAEDFVSESFSLARHAVQVCAIASLKGVIWYAILSASMRSGLDS
jgi:hypothetical protein